MEFHMPMIIYATAFCIMRNSAYSSYLDVQIFGSKLTIEARALHINSRQLAVVYIWNSMPPSLYKKATIHCYIISLSFIRRTYVNCTLFPIWNLYQFINFICSKSRSIDRSIERERERFTKAYIEYIIKSRSSGGVLASGA
jgi:hypothetical protein